MTYPTSKSMLTFNIERKMPTDEQWLQLNPAGVLCMNTEQADHLWDLFDGDIDIYIRNHPDDGRSDPDRKIDPVEWAKACVRRTGYNKNYWYVLQNEPNDAEYTVDWELKGGQWIVDNGFKCVVGAFGVGSPAKQEYEDGPVDWGGYLGKLPAFCMANKGRVRMGLHEYADRHNYHYSYGWYIARYEYLLKHYPDIEIAFLEFGFDNGDLDNSFFAGWRSGLSSEEAADQIIEMVEKVYFPNVKNVKGLFLFQYGSVNTMLWGNFDFAQMPFETLKRMFDAARYENATDAPPQIDSNDETDGDSTMIDMENRENIEVWPVGTYANIRDEVGGEDLGDLTVRVVASRTVEDKEAGLDGRSYRWRHYRFPGGEFPNGWIANVTVNSEAVQVEDPTPDDPVVDDPPVDDPQPDPEPEPIDLSEYVRRDEVQAMIDRAVETAVKAAMGVLVQGDSNFYKMIADAAAIRAEYLPEYALLAGIDDAA